MDIGPFRISVPGFVGALNWQPEFSRTQLQLFKLFGELFAAMYGNRVP